MLSIRQTIILKLSLLIFGLFIIGSIIIFAVVKGTPKVPRQPIAEEPTPTLSLPGASEFVLPSATAPPTTPAGLPISDVADGGPVLTAQLTSSAITAPSLTNGNQISYYDSRDGKFYTIDASGNIIELSGVSFPAAESVSFSASNEIVAIEFPDGSNILYNLSTETQITLPSHWEEFTFSSDSSQVASKSLGNSIESNALVVTSTDGSKTETVAALGRNADNITINFSPNDQIVAFSETGSNQSAFGRSEIYLIDLNGDVAGSLIVDGSNFSALWSPNGTHMLYSVAEANNSTATLWYARASGANIGGERTQILLSTWVEKCTFSSAKIVICAVPRIMVDSGGFDHRLVTSPDDLYSIDITTGRTALLGSPASNLQMFNLNVSNDKSLLYFTDSFGRLNTMRLK